MVTKDAWSSWASSRSLQREQSAAARCLARPTTKVTGKMLPSCTDCRAPSRAVFPPMTYMWQGKAIQQSVCRCRRRELSANTYAFHCFPASEEGNPIWKLSIDDNLTNSPEGPLKVGGLFFSVNSLVLKFAASPFRAFIFDSLGGPGFRARPQRDLSEQL